MSAPQFPPTRNVVGADEYYLLEEFDDWVTSCLRTEDDMDLCEASTTLSALDQGLELDLAFTPYAHYQDRADADVNLLPVAAVEILPYSQSPHYETYSAAITKVDGEPFGGYWCPLTTENCLRGPEFDWDTMSAVLEARTITVAVYDVYPEVAEEVASISKSFELKPVVEFEVPMQGFRSAYDRANSFTAEIWEIDLSQNDVQVNECSFSFQGKQKTVRYTYDEDYDIDQTSIREILRGPRGGGDCPGYVMLASLTTDMTQSQRELFCLDYDKETETYLGFQLGKGNAYSICKKPSKSFCEHVDNTKSAAMAITGFTTGAVGGTFGATTATGTTVVAHSSGAAILTGSGGYVAGTLGTIGTSALAVLTAPATVAAAAVSVIAVGGAVYVCSD
ncbi:hypothetical protein [Paracoccus sp. DMF]|uniref:hypothetical protein n=1 Tax=Paracoccus sp. DMF TaxID=400837 RepID=UPI001103616A|nr:hypothetical protein [Paracoccus sp. DMF]MCV2447514.1 hypothetical protein [Paracoccus sp. DMF]